MGQSGTATCILSCCLPISWCCISCSQRGEIRQLRGIDGSAINDCLLSFFCLWCVMIQNEVEVTSPVTIYKNKHTRFPKPKRTEKEIQAEEINEDCSFQIRNQKKNMKILLFAIFSAASAGDSFQECDFPLGVEDGRIPDRNFKASKSHADSAAAHYARLNNEDGAGAWCHPTISPEDLNEYLQIELLSIARITRIALQGRPSGSERAETVFLNVSLDGEHWSQHPDVFTVASDDDIIELSPSISGKFLRIIPRTDKGKPVCIRTEVIGCYRDDFFESYSLSSLPRDNLEPETGLVESSLSGVGRLVDGIEDEYLTFPASENGALTVTMKWTKPLNISELVFHVSARARGCLNQIEVTNSADETWRYNIDCARKVEHRIIPLLLEKVVTEIRIKISYTGVLHLSEISWTKDESEIAPIRMDSVLIELDSSLTTNQWITVGGVVLGGLLFLVILCVFLVVSRSNRSDKNFEGQSYDGTTIYRDGTFVNLVPSPNYSTGPSIVTNQSRFTQHSHVDYVLPAQSYPQYSYQPKLVANPSQKINEFGHEYSEIGSITADSGRGESLTENDHYAQLVH
ncbi:Oidioi.mRNA.OKI2018_I69.chr1.g3920.t1.cds [Oikopleura dioica]|uniref:Oidioi.mRNA.OKI2018_I69.chr1.g3920.t1.cds n=1 Tax=Oikopleura dioica TaxID=34765 RepID=A0ABN7T171_OIKDI|nr:Oidioi.mRNA.OKI2018_I69.chr1.g3920.t1.cds [Oikopleura dioica]